MTGFVAATGSNYDTANAFVDVAYVDDYHSLRGNAAWTGTTQAKQAAIVKATDYIEQTYAARWIGNGYTLSVLSWPRYTVGVYDDYEIPEPLKKASCELALEALTGDLNPALGTDAAVKRERVEGAVDTEYFEAKRSTKVRPVVAGYLAGLLGFSGINVAVVRV